MASLVDLVPRLAKLQSAGLAVVTDYRGSPAQWLQSTLAGVDVRAINCKGTKADDTLRMARLSKLEALIAQAQAEQSAPPPGGIMIKGE